MVALRKSDFESGSLLPQGEGLGMRAVNLLTKIAAIQIDFVVDRHNRASRSIAANVKTFAKSSPTFRQYTISIGNELSF